MTEDAQPTDLRTATWAHVAPFAAWLGLMVLPGLAPAWNYALRTAVGLGLLVWFRPWRWYGRLGAAHVPAALLAGAGVFALWVLPESGWALRHPALHEAYLRWGVLPFGRPPAPLSVFPCAPEICGWPLTIVRIAGSALVIAPIEEFFWRGFAYRWMLAKDFLRVDPGKLHWGWLLVVSAVFGFEHDRWLAGILAGLVYGLLFIRTRDIRAACLAHVVTNLLLGVYVVMTGLWGFW
jgi:uncharacterized protein